MAACHYDTKIKPEAATAIIELLTMGGKTPETCSAVNKRQDKKLKNCCIWFVIYLNCTMMHGLTNLKLIKTHLLVKFPHHNLSWVLVSGKRSRGAVDGTPALGRVSRGFYAGTQLSPELRQELHVCRRSNHSRNGASPQRPAPVHLLHGPAVGNREQAPPPRRDQVLLVPV